MARGNIPLLSFNRGLISKKAMARVDLERTRLSAEVFTNWLPKAQGAMRIRPGTKYLGSSINDTGAEWIEFVAATDDTALVELTHQKMRVWINDALLERPHVDTTLSLDDTGWVDASSGGVISGSSQVDFSGSTLVMNPTTIGAIARARKRVVVDTGDVNVEHSIALNISRGPITFRCGADTGEDDYITETNLETGYHNLTFTPTGNFHLTLENRRKLRLSSVIDSLSIGDTGTLEITTFLDAADLDNVRYDQSADVVYVACAGNETHKIERRGTGRSWSFVKYRPNNGPFLSAASSTARLTPTGRDGNAAISSDVPFFKLGHVGALFRLFHEGQSGVWKIGAKEAVTDAVEITGIGDTGTPSTVSERRLDVIVSGSYIGTFAIERSFDGPDQGFHSASEDFMAGLSPTDTGTFSRTVNDRDDNISVWYRLRMSAYTSGSATVTLVYAGGGVYGVARVTGFVDNKNVNVEVLSRFSDIIETDVWQEGAWSGVRGYPSAVALPSGRLALAGGANVYISVSDDYENFDDTTVGDAGPIIRTLGSGPVDNVYYLLSLLRLIIGTPGGELVVRSSSLDEPLTPDNCHVISFSTQGSANLRPLKMDTKGIFIQRSTQRVFLIGFAQGAGALSTDYDVSEMTLLVPDLLVAGVVSIAIQRQPDTRIHFVLADGKVAILTYEPQEEVICWSMWETDGSVERVMVLPGTQEDQVFYHINRTINGVTKRFLEKWALESESVGDTGLSWISDCAVSYTDTGRATVIPADHLVGESVVAWGDDTGQTNAGRDLSPDVAGVQTTYTVDTGGDIDISSTYSPGVRHAVVGLPFQADWKSTKLAYGAEFGTALVQMKRVDKIGFILSDTHNNGLFFGNDTGKLDPLPRKLNAGAAVDADQIFAEFDEAAMPFPGLWNSDSRVYLRGKAPRPVMVLAAVPTVNTSEKI